MRRVSFAVTRLQQNESFGKLFELTDWMDSPSEGSNRSTRSSSTSLAPHGVWRSK
jgi:hypothetical protein